MNSTSGDFVQFKASDGLILTGFLVKAKKPNGTVVIHVHGLGGNFVSWSRLFRVYGRALKQGFDLFTINTRGAGLTSVFRTDRKISLIGSSYEVFEDTIKDLSGAISAAEHLGYKQVILSGHSTGCQKITYYQSVKQDKKVKGLILLSPADDYNSNKKHLGTKFESAVALAKAMVSSGTGGQIMPEASGVQLMSAARFNSVANLENVEAGIFNYEAPRLEVYSKVRCPVLAVFGRREQYRTKPVKQYIERLRKDGHLEFTGKVVGGADHGFTGRSPTLSRIIGKWLIDRTA